MQGKFGWLVVAIASIWLGVLFISLFAPDFVSGSQQEHIQIAALVTWISGAMATRSIINGMLRRRAAEKEDINFWKGIVIGVAAIWVPVTLISIFVPPVLTGSDPTRIPLAAILAPIGGAIATGMLGQFVERAVLTGNLSTAMSCPKCGKDNPPEAKFCIQCGFALTTSSLGRFCAKCGADASSEGDYCIRCGSKLPQI